MSSIHSLMILRSIRVEKKDIGYVRWMFESHDGMATPTTRPETFDILDILVAPDFISDFEDLLSALSKEIKIEIVESPLSTSLQE